MSRARFFSFKRNAPLHLRQKGMTLVDLLVGIALGLMVILAAIGTLILSRTTSQAVTEQLELQQQGNMALRIMTNLIRQASSRELVVTGGGVVLTAMPTFTAPSVLALQPQARDANNNDAFGIAFSDPGPPNAAQDCLGNTNAPAGPVVVSSFSVVNNRLLCLGTNAAAGAQPIIADVQRFRVLYMVTNGTGAATTTNYFAVGALPANPNIVGLEMCLELATAPRFNPETLAAVNFINCDGAQVANDGRLRVLVRQAVRVRSVPVL